MKEKTFANREPIFPPLSFDPQRQPLLSSEERRRGMSKKFMGVSMSKKELAQLYCPNSPQSTADELFTRWIRRNKSLIYELESLHYNPHQKIFTPRQVETIIYYLGEPGE